MNTMAGILRGTGNMKLPSLMMLSSAVCQIILGGTLGLGLGPIPQFGMRGVAAGSLTAYLDQHLDDGLVSVFRPARASFPRSGDCGFKWAMFFDILKVGAVSCFSPLQSVLTISIFTHMLASFGTEILAGYGIGARLEFLLTSVAFAVGIASVPMIGMAIGAGRIARARRIAWTAGSVAFVSVGAIATFIAIFPDLWVNIFTGDAGVRAASQQYLSTAAPMYAFIGLAIVDVFLLAGRGQGARPGAGANRAAVVHRAPAAGGCRRTTPTAQNFFVLAAASMVVLGVLSCRQRDADAVGTEAGAVPAARPVLS